MKEEDSRITISRITIFTKNADLFKSIDSIIRFRGRLTFRLTFEKAFEAVFNFYSFLSICAEHVNSEYMLLRRNVNRESGNLNSDFMSKRGIFSIKCYFDNSVNNVFLENIKEKDVAKKLSICFPECAVLVEENMYWSFDKDHKSTFYVNGKEERCEPGAILATADRILTSESKIDYRKNFWQLENIHSEIARNSVVNFDSDSFDQSENLNRIKNFSIHKIDRLPDLLSDFSFSDHINLLCSYIVFEKYKTYGVINQMLEKNISAETIILMAISMYARRNVQKNNENEAVINVKPHELEAIEKVSSHAFAAELRMKGSIRHDALFNTDLIQSYMPAVNSAKNALRIMDQLESECEPIIRKRSSF